MRINRLSITTFAALCAAAALMTAVAAAHVSIERTSPKRGGSAKTSVSSVSVTFSGPLRRGTLKVTGPGGKTYSIGKGGRDPRKISRLIVELKGSKPAGRYKARYTLIAADGHDQKGTFRFRLRR
jgi:methionine-rich copper-binding protein CopC